MKHSIRSIVILWVFGTSSLWADLASTIREREETIGRLDGEIAAQSQALTRLKSLAESLEKSREEARSLEKIVESIR